MAAGDGRDIVDLGLLYDASRSVLGYGAFTEFYRYLTTIVGPLQFWAEADWIHDLNHCDEARRGVWKFDFAQLDLDNIVSAFGAYFYILATQKNANHLLMHATGRKRVLYLRGFDFELSLAIDGRNAVRLTTPGTQRFQRQLVETLGDCDVFKALSSRDIYWGILGAQRHFYGDYDGVCQIARRDFPSFYLSARHWRNDARRLMRRMDHFIVHISAITESVLWELSQLDTDDRRHRVTVVFDDKLIEANLGVFHAQKRMAARFEGWLWTKRERLPDLAPAELRARIARKFHTVDPTTFLADIATHRARIDASAAPIAAARRRAWIDFRFAPALPKARMKRLQTFRDELGGWIAAALGAGEIACLPLFLAQVQLCLFLDLLFGRHADAGRGLAAYAAVMRAAREYYAEWRAHAGGAAQEVPGERLALLEQHEAMATETGLNLLGFGSSHEFGDFRAQARDAFDAVFATTLPVAAAALNRPGLS